MKSMYCLRKDDLQLPPLVARSSRLILRIFMELVAAIVVRLGMIFFVRIVVLIVFLSVGIFIRLVFFLRIFIRIVRICN